jgi:hypothetical protein
MGINAELNEPEWRARYEMAVAAAGQAAQRAWSMSGVASVEVTPTKSNGMLSAMASSARFMKYTAAPASDGSWTPLLAPQFRSRHPHLGHGLEYRGETIAGVVVTPALGGHVWRALRGDGAFRDDTPIRVTGIGLLAESVLLYSGLSWFLNSGNLDVLVQLVSRVQKERGYGDAYGFMMVAQGSGELMVEHGVHPWDVAAVAPGAVGTNLSASENNQ